MYKHLKSLKKTGVVMLLISSLSLTAFAQKTNFSGTWMLNEGKIQFGEVPHDFLSKRYEVNQDQTQITITRVSTDDDGKDKSLTDALNFNGTPAEVPVGDGLTRSA